MRASLNKAKSRSRPLANGTGIGVDAYGNSVIDPTKNVEDSIEAAVARLDDLRAANNLLYDAKIAHLEDMTILRAEYEARLALAEAKRIDAIRAVDVNAVAVERQRSSDQASVLATQVQQSAEALRSLVATTQTSVAQAQQQNTSTLSARITTLEQAQLIGQGKQSFSDPMMEQMFSELKKMSQIQAAGAGQAKGIDKSWAVLGAGVLLLVGLLTIFNQVRPSTPAPAPQIVFQPGAIVVPAK
jgi:hypothetical protein